MNDRPKQIVKITLSPRDAADSPELLGDIAKSFQSVEYLEIDMSSPTTERIDHSVSKKIVEEATDVLDANDQAIQQGEKQVPSRGETDRRVYQWLQRVFIEGFKVTAQAMIREVIKRLADMI